jgi:hypothetical protein
MVDVLDRTTGQRLGFYVGAKSLFEALEKLRDLTGSIVGLNVRLRKATEAQTAPYIVELDPAGARPGLRSESSEQK